MKDILFVDKECEVCKSFGSYISKKSNNEIIIKDISNLDRKEFSSERMHFCSNNKMFSGHLAILEVVKGIEELSIIKKILNILPNFIKVFLYYTISKNRNSLAKLFKIIKPKS